MVDRTKLSAEQRADDRKFAGELLRIACAKLAATVYLKATEKQVEALALEMEHAALSVAVVGRRQVPPQ